MNLKFISLHEQHLFQVRSPLEGVQLFGEGHVGAGLRELRKSIQESGILEKVFFGLLYITLQLLEKTQWSENISSSYHNTNSHPFSSISI